MTVECEKTQLFFKCSTNKLEMEEGSVVSQDDHSIPIAEAVFKAQFFRRWRIHQTPNCPIQLGHGQFCGGVIGRQNLHVFTGAISLYGLCNNGPVGTGVAHAVQGKALAEGQVTVAAERGKTHHIGQKFGSIFILTVILLQTNVGNIQLQEVRQNIAASDRQQLIGVSQKNHAAAARHSVQDAGQHPQGEHAGLIDHHQPDIGPAFRTFSRGINAL